MAKRKPQRFAVLCHDGPQTWLQAELKRYRLQWHRKRLHPNVMHTLQTHMRAHAHTHTEKFITWFFLSLPAWKGSLAIATNHKRGSLVAKLQLLSVSVFKKTAKWEQVGQDKCRSLFFFNQQFSAIIIDMEICSFFFPVEFLNTSRTHSETLNKYLQMVIHQKPLIQTNILIMLSNRRVEANIAVSAWVCLATNSKIE